MARKGLIARLGQSFNPAGVRVFAGLLLGGRHLAIPHVNVPDIRWIDWDALRQAGFGGVVLDKDNTLTVPYARGVHPPLAAALAECQVAFPQKAAVLSNSAGLRQFDRDGSEARLLERQLGIPVIRHGAKKPAGDGAALAAHFGCETSRLVMVGDRYLTDVVFGNRLGMLTVRTAPLSLATEPFLVRGVRAAEDWLVGAWAAQGERARPHAQATDVHSFIKDPGCW